MLNLRGAWLLVICWLGHTSADARELSCEAPASPVACERPGDMRGVRWPERVLIVPLLHKGDDPVESEHWPENPARGISGFYRNAYRSRVEWLGNVREWGDYYEQVERLARQSAPFDRVVLVGHGGFDGPVLNRAVFRQSLEVHGGIGKLSRGIESQPGLQEAVTITYDATRNPAFSDYLAEHRRDLLKLDADPVQEAAALEARVQPLHRACANHCLSEPAGDSGRVAACEWVCRDSLFSAESAVGLAPERFLLFAAGLQKLVAEGGLIVIGSCNPGTEAKKGAYPWDTDGLLVHSALAGGPHESYVHLLAAATGRAVAGPIGKIGADDMAAFIAMLENNRLQRQLRLVFPAVGARAP